MDTTVQSFPVSPRQIKHQLVIQLQHLISKICSVRCIFLRRPTINLSHFPAVNSAWRVFVSFSSFSTSSVQLLVFFMSFLSQEAHAEHALNQVWWQRSLVHPLPAWSPTTKALTCPNPEAIMVQHVNHLTPLTHESTSWSSQRGNLVKICVRKYQDVSQLDCFVFQWTLTLGVWVCGTGRKKILSECG